MSLIDPSRPGHDLADKPTSRSTACLIKQGSSAVLSSLSRRRLIAGLGIAAAGSYFPAASAAVRPSRVDPFAVVDPELRGWLRGTFPNGPPPPHQPRTLSDMRPKPSPKPSLPSDISEYHVPGLSGEPDARVLVVGRLEPRRLRPAILHIHGGGYVAGRADDSVPWLKSLAASFAQETLIATVDYRLAPETRYPGALHDNLAALRWLHQNASVFGVDPDRIILLGESAGGGHAAALAIAARDEAIPIRAQMLLYPMLDDRTGSTRTVPTGIGEFMWTASQNRFGWGALLAVPAGSSLVSARAVPARAANLAGLAPCFIAVGSIDLFVDEDITYAERLLGAGVSTELHVFPGAFHGFDVTVPSATVSQELWRLLVSAIDRASATANRAKL